MIIVQLKGGLGNQMFQYAAGRSLSLQYRVPLMLDTASFEPRQAGMYALNALQIKAGIAAEEDIAPFTPSVWRKILYRIAPLSMRRVYREPHFHFDPRFFSARPPLYMKGYWQSWRYFQSVEQVIREDFGFREDFSDAIQAKAARLQEHHSVAMHFRRGDYTNPETAAYHGVCGPDYYKDAAKWMQEQFPDAYFYIFTNDPAWVRGNLPEGIRYEILSGDLSHTQYEDLFLMSRCRHQIIANSSYSWWAAWLNPYPAKQVVAPRKWFDGARLNTGDLIPSNWKSI